MDLIKPSNLNYILDFRISNLKATVISLAINFIVQSSSYAWGFRSWIGGYDRPFFNEFDEFFLSFVFPSSWKLKLLSKAIGFKKLLFDLLRKSSYFLIFYTFSGLKLSFVISLFTFFLGFPEIGSS